MKSSRSRRVLFGAVSLIAVVAIAIPALGQEKPESLLPPGFGDPAPAPAPTPAATPGRTPSAPPPRAPVDLLPDLATTTPAEAESELTDEAKAEEEETAEVDPYDLPEAARRSPAFVGVLTAANGGLGEAAWGTADGRSLSILMRKL